MTSYDFTTPIDRRGTTSVKWDLFHEDVLAAWVADMDFAIAPAIRDALHERIEHPVFGYTFDNPALRETLVKRMADLYSWQISTEDIVFLPGVITGMSATVQAFGSSGGGMLMQPPVYPPFMNVTGMQNMENQFAQLVESERDGHLYYEIDFDAFEAAIEDNTQIFMLCSPHNPVGRVWTREELTRIAEICCKHDVLICSDEIHCDLILDENTPHIPTASLSPEIEANTITLMAPSKTFNIPSLGCSFAIIPDAALRRKFSMALWQMGAHASVMGLVAAEAAYKDGLGWLAAALDMMRENRDYAVAFINENLPGVRTTVPEGTFLAWLDCRELPVPDADLSHWFAPGVGAMMASNIQPFFLEHGQVALNNGARFGPGGEGFARLNFATPRATLETIMQRMQAAMAQAGVTAG